MATPAEPRPRALRTRNLWIGYWLVLFVLTHVPVPGRGEIPVKFGDKLLHFGAYFVLTWLGGRALLRRGSGSALGRLAFWGAVYVAYAGIDEWLQSFVGRTMSASDWAADLAGVVVATVILAWRRRPPALSEQRSGKARRP